MREAIYIAAAWLFLVFSLAGLFWTLGGKDE